MSGRIRTPFAEPGSNEQFAEQLVGGVRKEPPLGPETSISPGSGLKVVAPQRPGAPGSAGQSCARPIARSISL
jgi:hypothetical protein